ncbi:MAG: zinc-binding alcohol dehydrogenase [bacterium]
MKTKALKVTGLNTIELSEINIPDLLPGQVLIKNIYTAISPGTELRCMAQGQPGSEDMPFIPGYSALGTIIAPADAAIPVGTVVFHNGAMEADIHLMWGGHTEYAIRPVDKVYLVPETVNLKSAALTKLAAIPYHGMRLAKIQPDEKVAVIGLGPIGMCSSLCVKSTGADLFAFDLSEKRVELAKSLGINAFQVEGSIYDTAHPLIGDGANVVIDSTGAPAVLPQSARLLIEPEWDITLRETPRLILQGSFKDEFTLNYQEIFRQEATILVPRNDNPQDYNTVLSMQRRGLLPLDKLIGEPLNPTDCMDIYTTLRTNPQAMLTAVFSWDN